MGLFASLRHNFGRLFDFGGRETRALFWPYVLILFVASMVLDTLILVPVLIDMLIRIQNYLLKHPEGWPQGEYGPGQVPLPPELMPDLSATLVLTGIVNLVLVLLVAAAVVRRLHDRDLTGFWGLLPLPFMAVGQAMAPQGLAMMTGAGPPDPATFFLVSLNGVLYWGALIGLVVLLALDGTAGPNRYGPEPPTDS